MADAPSRPADRFFAKLGPALQAHGISTEAPRREWPAEVLRRTLLELTAETPRDLISQAYYLLDLLYLLYYYTYYGPRSHLAGD